MSNDVRDTTACILDEDRVRAIAKLARLDLTDDEVRRLQGEVGQIVALADSLAKLDEEPGASTLLPRIHATSFMPLRGDEPSPSLDRDLVLAEAPRAVDGGFAVPTFVDEG
jgi:aspartyl-tRNA(Asn)/glutamyl-tRNA(Gln) amidotransferase subunit C